MKPFRPLWRGDCAKNWKSITLLNMEARLTMAEIELSVLSRQCLNRRIGSQPELEQPVAAWQQDRNTQAVKVNWRFTTDDARIKLKRLYPLHEL